MGEGIKRNQEVNMAGRRRRAISKTSSCDYWLGATSGRFDGNIRDICRELRCKAFAAFQEDFGLLKTVCMTWHKVAYTYI